MKAEDLKRLHGLRQKCRDTLAHSKQLEAQLQEVIADRKRITQGLSSSRAQFRIIADNIREILWLSDPDRKSILFINPRCEEVLFHKPEDFRADARCFLENVHPEDCTEVERFLGTPAVNTKETSFRVIAPDGSVRWLRERCVPVLGETGEVAGLVGVTEDVTENRLAQQALARAYEDLEKKVMERTRDLRKASEDIRRLADHLDSVREEENRRIAQEIHDVLGQTLTAAKMRVAIFKGMKRRPTGEELEALESMLGDMAEDVRRISHTLRPTILDHFGLSAALEWLAEEFQKTAQIPCAITGNRGELNLDPPIAINVFRICQEALNNVVKHGNASRVDINLTAQNDQLEVMIADDGKGFRAGEAGKKGMGLIGMQERALRLGGEVRVDSVPSKGTTVCLRIPTTKRTRAETPDVTDPQGVQ